jgi:hypothetical protein
MNRAQLIGQKPQGNVVEIPALPPGFVSLVRTQRGVFYTEQISMIAAGMSFMHDAYESRDSKILRHRNVWLCAEPHTCSGVVAPSWWSTREEIAINPS